MHKKRNSSTELAFKILKREKRPMTSKEIINVAFSEYGLEMNGKTPDATLNSNFINERKRRKKSNKVQRFIKIAPGKWGLAEYLGKYYDVANSI